jgi:chromosomal replication initiation ATPase DnaA
MELAVTQSSQRFIRDLEGYLTSVELSDVDRRKIINIFDRHQEVQIVKEPASRLRKYYPETTRSKMKMIGKPNLKPDIIIDYVAKTFNLADFNTARTRRGQYPVARFMAMLLLDKCTHLSLKGIGELFHSPYRKGTLDHTTVIHGLREGKNMVDTIPYYASIYTDFFTINNLMEYANAHVAVTE